MHGAVHVKRSGFTVLKPTQTASCSSRAVFSDVGPVCSCSNEDFQKEEPVLCQKPFSVLFATQRNWIWLNLSLCSLNFQLKMKVHFFFLCSFLSFFFLTFIYFWERERERERERDREGDTESKAGSRLWAISPEPNVGLKPMNHEIMTWAEVRSSTDWATQEPQFITIIILEHSIAPGLDNRYLDNWIILCLNLGKLEALNKINS